MKKKGISMLLVASMMIAVLGGCGTEAEKSAPEADGTEGSASAEEAVVELEFVNQKREAADTFQVLVDEFNAANPDVHVTLNTTPDGSGVLMTRASSGTLPDIMTHWPEDAQYVQFAKEGLLVDMKDKEYTGNVIDSYVEEIKLEDGGVYILPLSLNFMGIYYNVDKFEEAGLSIPSTWDELISVCDEIVAKGEVPFLLPNKDGWTISDLWNNISGKDRGNYKDFYAGLNDGTLSYAEDEIARDSLEKMVLLADEYSQGDTLSLGYDQAINDFATGKSYMFIQGSWALPSIEAANPDINVEIFPMPNDSGDMKQPVGVDSAICVSSKAAEDEVKGTAIDRFMSFLYSKESGQKYSDMDHSPSAIKGVEADIPQGERITELIETAGVLDVCVPPAGLEDSKRNEIQNIFMGTSVDDFLAWLDQEWVAARDAQAE